MKQNLFILLLICILQPIFGQVKNDGTVITGSRLVQVDLQIKIPAIGVFEKEFSIRENDVYFVTLNKLN